MADLGDVADTLVNLASAAIYPNGVAAGSPLGVNARIYRGNPSAKALDNDLQAGFSQADGRWTLATPAARIRHVSVNGRPGVGRVLKPYVFASPAAPVIPPSAISVAIAGNTVTIAGAIAQGQGVAVSVGGAMVGTAAGPADTLASLAARLASLISATTPATAAGAVITIPAAAAPTTALQANTFVQVTTSHEVARQVAGFEVTIRTPGRDLRDAVSRCLTPVFGGMTRLALPDGSQGLLNIALPVELDDDKPEKELLFVRKLFYAVEFPVIAQVITTTQALIGTSIQNPAGTVLATTVGA